MFTLWAAVPELFIYQTSWPRAIQRSSAKTLLMPMVQSIKRHRATVGGFPHSVLDRPRTWEWPEATNRESNIRFVEFFIFVFVCWFDTLMTSEALHWYHSNAWAAWRTSGYLGLDKCHESKQTACSFQRTRSFYQNKCALFQCQNPFLGWGSLWPPVDPRRSYEQTAFAWSALSYTTILWAPGRSAPIVTMIISFLWAKRPELHNDHLCFGEALRATQWSSRSFSCFVPRVYCLASSPSSLVFF